LPVRILTPTPRVEVVGDGQHFLDRAAETVELPDDERVALAEGGGGHLPPAPGT
jgi:hypothetical protein